MRPRKLGMPSDPNVEFDFKRNSNGNLCVYYRNQPDKQVEVPWETGTEFSENTPNEKVNKYLTEIIAAYKTQE